MPTPPLTYSLPPHPSVSDWDSYALGYVRGGSEIANAILIYLKLGGYEEAFGEVVKKMKVGGIEPLSIFEELLDSMKVDLND